MLLSSYISNVIFVGSALPVYLIWLGFYFQFSSMCVSVVHFVQHYVCELSYKLRRNVNFRHAYIVDAIDTQKVAFKKLNTLFIYYCYFFSYSSIHLLPRPSIFVILTHFVSRCKHSTTDKQFENRIKAKQNKNNKFPR